MAARVSLFFGGPDEESPLSSFEYTAIPAPLRSDKAKGTKDPAERYALTLTEAINKMAGDGWEYLRAETLPSEERSGLTGRTTLFHNLLIFRREAVAASHRADAPVIAAAPAPVIQDAPKPAVPEAPKPAVQEAPKPVEASTASPIFSETMRVTEQAAPTAGTKPAG